MESTDELYECAGCGGEVSVVEAIWLPERPLGGEKRPYCSRECCQINAPNVDTWTFKDHTYD